MTNGQTTALDRALLGLLAAIVLAWAGVVWRATETMDEGLRALRADISVYQVQVERRITIVEERARHCCRPFEGGNQ